MSEGKRQIKVASSNYWCEVTGKGEPVLLLHGFTGSTTTWGSLVSTLKTTFQVITIDLPGHGKTEVSSPKTMRDCCADIKAIIKQLGYEKVHLLGYSMGGRTALSFAMIYPELVQSLVLESASPGLEKEEDRKARIKKDQILTDRIRSDGLASFVNFWESIPLFESQKKLPDSVQRAIREERLSQHEEGLIMSLNHMGNGVQPSWWDELETLTLPVLLVVGVLDAKFVNLNKTMHNRIPQSNLVIVQEAGHAIHVEQSDFFGKIVSGFILNKPN
ncbi:2-succinyl-6-hydroxy-2,4-cyclohexadiene-1-carboxylate synthase [Virgibacillus necropolis]|uniref:2-succinyl-6-hydroxy-2, 4-cyclohexadiene-1-carboxylate synthase n=1 Tax=Virgibacillus necropolis TaxID=163877 RepID=UPI00384D5E9A